MRPSHRACQRTRGVNTAATRGGPECLREAKAAEATEQGVCGSWHDFLDVEIPRNAPDACDTL